MHTPLGRRNEELARSFLVLVEVPNTKSLKVRARHRAANTAVVVEQAHTERAQCKAWIAQTDGDLQKLMVNLDIMDRRNSVAALEYCMLSDERDSLKYQTASAGVCRGEMVKRLAMCY